VIGGRLAICLRMGAYWLRTAVGSWAVRLLHDRRKFMGGAGVSTKGLAAVDNALSRSCATLGGFVDAMRGRKDEVGLESCGHWR